MGEGQRTADGLEQIRAMAMARGGEVVDPVYAGVRARYTFRCACGPIWQAEGLRG